MSEFNNSNKILGSKLLKKEKKRTGSDYEDSSDEEITGNQND